MTQQPHLDAVYLDCRGLKSSETMLALSEALKRLDPKRRMIHVVADAPGFADDVASWCRATLSELLQLQAHSGGGVEALVQVSEESGTLSSIQAFDSAPHKLLDCRGMQCPEPIIRISKVMRTLEPELALHVLADDPAFPMDVKSWCRNTGAKLVALNEMMGVYRAVMHHPSMAESKPDNRSPTLQDPEVVPSDEFSRDDSLEEPTVLDAQAAVATRRQHGPALAPAFTQAGPPRGAPAPPRPSPRPRPVPSPAPRPEVGGHRPGLPSGAPAGGDNNAIERFRGHLASSTSGRSARASNSQNRMLARTADEGSRSHERVSAPISAVTAAQREGINIDLIGVDAATAQAMMRSLDGGQLATSTVSLRATHPEFARDIVAWCAERQHTLVSLDSDASPMQATVRLGVGGPAPAPATAPTALVQAGETGLARLQKRCSIMVLRSDMESLIASLSAATIAASSGIQVTIYFAFFGVNVLRGDKLRTHGPEEKVMLVQRILKWIMPRGARRQRLSRLSLGGAGGVLVRWLFRRKNLMVAEELLMQAASLGARFQVCTMSMSVMGITQREIIDLPNVEFVGMASFIDEANQSAINMVF